MFVALSKLVTGQKQYKKPSIKRRLSIPSIDGRCILCLYITT